MTIYYFDVNGDDSNDGLSEATPWQSVDKVRAFSFNPGDEILLHREQIFYETLRLESPDVAIRTYGEGVNPIIDGSEIVQGWKKYDRAATPDIWRVNWPNDAVKLFINGNCANPREGIVEDVNSEGDWFYDESTRKIYIYSVGNPDDVLGEVRVNYREHGLLIYGPSNVIVDGIDCTRAVVCMKVSGESKNILVQNLSLSHSGPSSGFHVSGNATVMGKNIKAFTNGVDMYGHGYYLANKVANGFLLEDCDAYENLGTGFHVYNSNGGNLVRPKSYDNVYSEYIFGNLVANAIVRIRE